MEGHPTETSLTKWKWSQCLSLTDMRWMWWRRDALCPSWRLADLGWVIECYHNLERTPSIQFNCPLQTRSSSQKINIAVSQRDEEKDCPEPFPVGTTFKNCYQSLPNNLQVSLIWHLSHYLQLGIMRSNWPSAGAISYSWVWPHWRPAVLRGHTQQLDTLGWPGVITIQISPKQEISKALTYLVSRAVNWGYFLFRTGSIVYIL